MPPSAWTLSVPLNINARSAHIIVVSNLFSVPRSRRISYSSTLSFCKSTFRLIRFIIAEKQGRVTKRA